MEAPGRRVIEEQEPSGSITLQCLGARCSDDAVPALLTCVPVGQLAAADWMDVLLVFRVRRRKQFSCTSETTEAS